MTRFRLLPRGFPGRWTRRKAIASLLALAALLTGVVWLVAGGPGTHRILDSKRLQELQREQRILHDSLEVLIAQDPDLGVAMAESAHIAIALRESLIHDLFHEVARSYLDHVELDLTPEDLVVRERGEMKVNTPLGKLRAGQWRVRLVIHRLTGVLSAGPPVVRMSGTNRLNLAIPTSIRSGQGEASLEFHWDPKGIVNVVCRSFETRMPIVGEVVPREYIVAGDFLLEAGSENLVADPEFPPERFLISVEPSEETWRAIRRELETQDRLLKCGLVIDPSEIVGKLRALCARGFRVKLPRKVFRSVELPARITRSVTVGRSRVALSARANVLRVTPGAFWYSASVRTGSVRATS